LARSEWLELDLIAPFAILREFCGTQSCAVLHRGAFVATGAPANRLMQLMQLMQLMWWISICD
jgi:hypothetical protein